MPPDTIPDSGDRLTRQVLATLDRLAGDQPRLGIALSGGGDSVALLHLAHRWAVSRGKTVAAVTIDHGLRPESADEARFAAKICDDLGVDHRVLRWREPPQSSGNLMAAARAARLRMISGWAHGGGFDAVAQGHTRDDVAETLIMRLSRGSGLDGLAAMAETRHDHGITWLRPLLDCGRQELRDWLQENGLDWVDDPTNLDHDYDRPRIRAAIAQLGLDTQALARSARNLALARDALGAAALALMQGARADATQLYLPLPPLLDAAAELRRRVLVAALGWVSGIHYPPRQAALDRMIQTIAHGRRATLAGVIGTPRTDEQPPVLHLMREPAAAARAPNLTESGIWDRRFNVPAPPPGAFVAAIPGTALPGLWQGIACIGPAPAQPLRGLDALRKAISTPRFPENNDIFMKLPESDS